MRSCSSSSSSSMAVALLLLLLMMMMMAVAFIPSLASSRGLVNVTSTTGDGHELLMMGRFHGWMAAHGRSYVTADEKLRRFEIYRENMEFIKAVNLDCRLTYRLGKTPFTDFTHDKLLEIYTNSVEELAMAVEEEVVITTHAGQVREGGCSPAAIEEPRRNLTVVA